MTSDNVEMSTFSGIRVARRIEDREYREVPGSQVAVSRLGNVRDDGEILEIDSYPHVTIATDDGLARVNVPAAVATTWLDLDQRDRIRAELPNGAGGQDKTVSTLSREFGVWKWAIVHVSRHREHEIEVLSDIPESRIQGKDVQRIENAEITSYRTFLVEQYRPPSKGGNTSAVHSHVVEIDGQTYSWLARGQKKWIVILAGLKSGASVFPDQCVRAA